MAVQQRAVATKELRFEPHRPPGGADQRSGLWADLYTQIQVSRRFLFWLQKSGARLHKSRLFEMLNGLTPRERTTGLHQVNERADTDNREQANDFRA